MIPISAGMGDNPRAVSREIHSIPIAPRAALWAPLVWHRWPLLRSGSALVIIGALWAWMLYLGSLGGQDTDVQLDNGSRAGTATITQVVPAVRSFDGKTWDRASYTVQNSARTEGSSFVPSGTVAVGDSYPVEIHLISTKHNVNRLAGGRRYLIAWWARPGLYMGLIVAPGCLLLMMWLSGTFELRRLMAEGDISLAEVTDSRLIGMAPPMLLVSYRYRDHRANVRTARHRVRTQSELGVRLRRGEHRFPVAVHRRWPEMSRLVVAADFAQDATPTSADTASMGT